jgi:catechol 2,3-dioxygenase-like lactoylglutathione lyase family enzyme
MATQIKDSFDVGGIKLDRPFKIRRLGHFGFYAKEMEDSLRFYRDLLGFQVTDVLDFGGRANDPKDIEGKGDTRGYFMRYGTDHHAFVLFPYRVRKAIDYNDTMADGATMNQITWQVGSLREVREATDWFRDIGVHYGRTGRDLPGSNWHVYPVDPDGRVNELFYGIEQIGWNGLSKPQDIYDKKFVEPPEIPYIREAEEVRRAVEAGVDLFAGTNSLEQGDAEYDVGGVMLPRPFKVTGIGPVRLFTDAMDDALSFYVDQLGFVLTESTDWNGQACHFLRCGNDHHSLALYPIGLREELGLTDWSTNFSFGVRVNDYAQLKNAIAWLQEKGAEIRYYPPELFPGMDYSAFAIDPDGHAIQLYCYMEQVGWDGRPRPADQRRKIDNENWPDMLDPVSDSFAGEQFMGPWG